MSSPVLAAPAAPVVSVLGWILLLALVAAVGLVLFRRQQAAERRRLAGRVALPPGADDLGVSPVRVAGAEPFADDVGVSAARPVSRSATPSPEPSRPAPSAERARPAAARPDARDPYVRDATDLWPGDGRAAGHLIASLAAHVGGAVAVLRHDAASRAFVTEALAGGGRPAAPVDAETCVLGRTPQDRVVTFLDADDLDGLRDLAPHGAYARALAGPPAAPVYLVVALPASEPDPEVPDRVGRYADLLAEITALGVEGAPEAGALEDEVAEDAAPVPRAAIIADEQDAARAEGRALAFALVTLADAEDLLVHHAPEDVAAAEAALRQRLGRAPDVCRVEPFGDLLFGVFLDLDRAGTAAWCDRLSSGAPPLFIGAVAPADGDPQAVRAAAAEALRDAYDQRRAHVVEV